MKPKLKLMPIPATIAAGFALWCTPAYGTTYSARSLCLDLIAGFTGGTVLGPVPAANSCTGSVSDPGSSGTDSAGGFATLPLLHGISSASAIGVGGSAPYGQTDMFTQDTVALAGPGVFTLPLILTGSLFVSDPLLGVASVLDTLSLFSDNGDSGFCQLTAPGMCSVTVTLGPAPHVTVTHELGTFADASVGGSATSNFFSTTVVPVSGVPEPGSWPLTLLALLCLGGLGWRQRQALHVNRL